MKLQPPAAHPSFQRSPDAGRLSILTLLLSTFTIFHINFILQPFLHTHTPIMHFFTAIALAASLACVTPSLSAPVASYDILRRSDLFEARDLSSGSKLFARTNRSQTAPPRLGGREEPYDLYTRSDDNTLFARANRSQTAPPRLGGRQVSHDLYAREVDNYLVAREAEAKRSQELSVRDLLEMLFVRED